MGKEYKVGEIFEYEGLNYITIIGDSCADCHFNNNGLCDPRRQGKIQPELINKDIVCLPSLREDKTGVIFKEIDENGVI